MAAEEAQRQLPLASRFGGTPEPPPYPPAACGLPAVHLVARHSECSNFFCLYSVSGQTQGGRAHMHCLAGCTPTAHIAVSVGVCVCCNMMPICGAGGRQAGWGVRRIGSGEAPKRRRGPLLVCVTPPTCTGTQLPGVCSIAAYKQTQIGGLRVSYDQSMRTAGDHHAAGGVCGGGSGMIAV